MTELTSFSSSLFWVLFTIVLLHVVSDSLLTYMDVKRGKHPLVGSSLHFAPRFILINLMFASSAIYIVNQGHQKSKARTFQVVRWEGNVVVLPNSLVEELAGLPTTVASPHGALEHDLLGSYTGLDVILESRLHHSIVQRRFMPRLGLITAVLKRSLFHFSRTY
ncbi:hypothetical protein F5Y11DRAFT_824 [Daldinia sp. FL1419]|nr:hypothetical protein F5Y11DRAFT_824 [Daldinia sp. FL1419]